MFDGVGSTEPAIQDDQGRRLLALPATGMDEKELFATLEEWKKREDAKVACSSSRRGLLVMSEGENSPP